ncbi:MAG: DinB family protein [Lewinellaceae bacterium]|nr:DinB family protein [Lewinellaceae bacterium]
MNKIAKNLSAAIESARPRLLLLNETDAAHKPAPEKWSPKEILGHLIDSAANNHQRFVRAQAGVTNLQPYRYTQDQWVGLQHYQSADWQTLVSLWYFYNAHLAHVITNIRPEFADSQLDVWNEPATLRFVAEDYVRHLNHHLTQIFS